VKHWPTLITFGMQHHTDTRCDCNFAHLTLILLLHYLVKCSSCSLAVYSSEFILGSACMHRLKPGVKINGTLTITTLFETDAASWHSCSIWKHVFRFWAGQCPITSHQRCSSVLLDQETPDFIPPALWPPNLPDLNPVDNVECASGASLSQDFGRRQTETTHQQWVGCFASHGYWMCCWRMGQRLCARIHAAGRHFDTRCNKDDVIWDVWLFWEALRQ